MPSDNQKKQILILAEGSVTTGSLVNSLRESFNAAAYDVKLIRAHDITGGKILANNNVAAFFLPGVQDPRTSYRANLSPALCKEISAYVERGGTFVGLCAGAYLSTQYFEYRQKDTGRLKKVHSPLPFFEGEAFGPIPQYTPPVEDIYNPAANNFVAKLAFNEAAQDGSKEGAACYSLGPYLTLPKDPEKRKDYKVIARFADVAGKPVAIASRNVGKGKAIFCGVVPEVSARHMPDIEKHADRLFDGKAAKFIREMSANEPARQRTWNVLVREIGQP